MGWHEMMYYNKQVRIFSWCQDDRSAEGIEAAVVAVAAVGGRQKSVGLSQLIVLNEVETTDLSLYTPILFVCLTTTTTIKTCNDAVFDPRS